MSYVFSEGFLLVLACLMAFAYWRLAIYKKGVVSEYLQRANFPNSVAKRSYFAFFVRTVCLVSAWILLSICLVKIADTKSHQNAPQIASVVQTQTLLPKIDEVAFVLDLSASMGAKDTSNGASRLDRAKEIISAMIENLGGINASLIGFAGNCQTVVPDTLDYLYFRILMDSSGINDTGEAGTNLLAMVDTIQQKYVNGPYRKSVRIILLTDGEDTGFLDMSDAAKAKAENVLIQHLGGTVSDTLDWEIIGLGTVNGAEVPGVIFESKPVVSYMRQALLQKMAKAGGGHFYAEKDATLTEICDDILADVAGAGFARQGQNETPSSIYALHATTEVLMLLYLAITLLFASLVLPQNERKVVV